MKMMTSQDNERYRRQQEEFVSNIGGSTSREVLLAILPSIFGILLTSSTLSLLSNGINRNFRILIEFCLTIIPCVLCCTILSDRVITVCLTMVIISGINIFVILIRSKVRDTVKVKSLSTTRRPFVTNFRALANVLTIVCILAVDFHVFPRKFGKTEIYGYSLMDTGVGFFVIANSLVAPETREFENPSKDSIVRIFMRNSKKSVKNCTPLLLLGLGRFIAIEYIGYQKHVTEYGVHWNFFVTLAFVKMFTSTISSAVNSRYSLVTGIWIIAMHEYALSTKGLKEWVLGDGPRDDFVSANREGLVSVPGYVGLYLVGIAIGRLIHSTYKNIQQRTKFKSQNRSIGLKIFGRNVELLYNESMILCVKLSIIAAQACAATLLCDRYFRVSRRLANSAYCAWVLTLSCTVLTLLLLIEIKSDIIAQANSWKNENSSKPIKRDTGNRTKKKHVGFAIDEPEQTNDSRTLEIFEAVNYNGLTFFLLANLLTGIINMSVKTLYVDNYRAIQIIVGYTAFCHFVAVVMYRFKVQIKL